MPRETTSMKTCLQYAFAITMLIFANLAGAQTVTLQGLFEEMTALENFSDYPSPAYTTHQASSYDRASGPPRNDPQWFANGDYGQFIRSEVNGGRTEYVLMDVAGAGVITRIWSANAQGTIRFYLNGSSTPTIEKDMNDFLSAQAGSPYTDPFSHVAAKGYNLYFPIPFGSSCKVTAEGADVANWLFYHINYRLYEGGTTVETYSEAAALALNTTVQQQANLLNNPDSIYTPSGSAQQLTGQLTVNGAALTHNPMTSRVIRRLQLSPSDLTTETLRQTLLEIDFDGGLHVQVPLGDLFGNGLAHNPYQSLPFTVTPGGDFICRWPMPMQQGFELRLTSARSEVVTVDYQVDLEPYTWNTSSLYFNAHWLPDHTGFAHGDRDFNFIDVTGQGIYAGNSLNVTNPFDNWWGEGDEKIYVDGATWPQHFGTGTEDYYGTAWFGTNEYEHAYHAQPRLDEESTRGYSTNNRFHAFDPITFTSSLEFDMEQMGIFPTDISVLFDVTNYWYARPGATHNLPALTTADLTIPDLHRFEDKDVPGIVIEGEDMTITTTDGGLTLLQPMYTYEINDRIWSNHRQMFWDANDVGSIFELQFNLTEGGEFDVFAFMTKAADYGIFQLSLDGMPLGSPIDLYATEVIPTEGVALGRMTLAGGLHTLRVEPTGANPSAIANHIFGLDCLSFVKVTGFGDREVPGVVIEGEAMSVQEASGTAGPQSMESFEDVGKLWSGHSQMFWLNTGAASGVLRLNFDVPDTGHYRVYGYPTLANDYGIFEFSIDGKPAGNPLDTYGPEVFPEEAVNFGVHTLSAGTHELLIECTGINAAAIPSYRMGLDCLSLIEIVDYGERDVPGIVIEGEAMTVVSASGDAYAQVMDAYEDVGKVWSGHEQLYWFNDGFGGQLALTFDVPAAGEYRVHLYPTQAWDFGIVQAAIDGAPVGFPVDAYGAEVFPAEAINLGVMTLEAGQHALGFESTGINPSANPFYFFGFDCLSLTTPLERIMPASTIEGEDLVPLMSATSGIFNVQDMDLFETENLLWSKHQQAFWTGGAVGDTLTLTFESAEGGAYWLRCFFTAGIDYAIVQVRVNGEAVREPVDLYQPAPTPLDGHWLGEVDLAAGENTVSFEITGLNPSATPGLNAFGLDAVTLDPVSAARNFMIYN